MVVTIQAIDVPTVYSIQAKDELFMTHRNTDEDGFTSYEESKISFKDLANNISMRNFSRMIDPDSDVQVVYSNGVYQILTTGGFKNVPTQIQYLQDQIQKQNQIFLKYGIN